MIELPNKKKCYNLPEQVAQNLLNIQYLAEQYKNIDALPVIWQTYKEEFDRELETFGEWTTTFEGWDTTLSTYLANMSSAAVGAIAGQNIAPGNVAATGNITANSIIENMSGYSVNLNSPTGWTFEKIYISAAKTGNKLTVVVALNVTKGAGAQYNPTICDIKLPVAVYDSLYPTLVGGVNGLDFRTLNLFSAYDSYITTPAYITKVGFQQIRFNLASTALVQDTKYYLRYEATFLLSDNLPNT